MGPAYKWVPCPWGSLEFPLTPTCRDDPNLMGAHIFDGLGSVTTIHHLERIDGAPPLPLVLVYHGPLLTFRHHFGSGVAPSTFTSGVDNLMEYLGVWLEQMWKAMEILKDRPCSFFVETDQEFKGVWWLQDNIAAESLVNFNDSYFEVDPMVG